MSNTTTQNRIVGWLCALLAAVSLLGYVLYLTDTVAVTFVNGDGTVTTGRTLEGFAPWYMPAPVEKPRYTFVGWEAEDGTLYWVDGFKPREDMTLTAKYMVAWETEKHIAYLPVEDNGFVRPKDPLTKGEAAQILDNLYEMSVKCSPHYCGPKENEDYYIAVGKLYTLGLVDRNARFNSQQPITRGELLELLTAFYPAKRSTVFFGDLRAGDAYYDAFVQAASLGWIQWGYDVMADPNGTISRGEAAALMNRILGRQPAEEVTAVSVGVFPDLKYGQMYYGDLAEALVEHKYVMRDGVEYRRNWVGYPRLPEGRVFVGNTHYYVGADGRIVQNDVVDDFIYGPDGAFTTGMPALDVLLADVLDEILSPNMTQEERLRAAFDYTVDGFTYLRIEYQKRRSTGWGESAAYKMLSTGYGNCFNYAAVFYELSRVLGEEPTLISGAVGIYGAPHGWVEFYEGKTRYVCDPELEMAIKKKTGRSPQLYMISGWKLNSQMYYR